jgi:hypothetical protein
MYITYQITRMPIPLAPGVSDPRLAWPIIEFGIAVLCTIVYAASRRKVAVAGIGMSILHWGYWGWLFGGPDYLVHPLRIIVSVIGLFGKLVWGFYWAFDGLNIVPAEHSVRLRGGAQ